MWGTGGGPGDEAGRGPGDEAGRGPGDEAGGGLGDEADESTVEARDKPVEYIMHLLLPELEASSAGCKQRRIILVNSPALGRAAPHPISTRPSMPAETPHPHVGLTK